MRRKAGDESKSKVTQDFDFGTETTASGRH